MKRIVSLATPALALALCIGGAAAPQALAQSAPDDGTSATSGRASTTSEQAAESSSANTGEEDAASTGSASSTASASDPNPSASGDTPSTANASAQAAGAAAQDVQPSAATTGAADAGASRATPPATSQPGQSDSPASTEIGANAQAADADAAASGQASLEANMATQQNLTAGLDFGEATAAGLAISSVAPQSFFFDSGLRPGDVIVSYAGQPIRSQADFNRWVVYQPGQRVPVVVLRDGRRETIYVTYRQQHPGTFEHRAGYSPQSGGAYLGVTFDPLAPGAVVRAVAPGSPAERAGIRPGHVIVGVNDRQVSSYDEVIGIIAAQQPGTQVNIAVAHPVVLGFRPAQPQTALRPQPVPAPALPEPENDVRAYGGTIDAQAEVGAEGQIEAGRIARPGDADRDGRVLDGDGRINRREAARGVDPGRR
ncbi:MAG: hypothetical protein DCC67_01750 [Planctomycetota bacterium]|nr:MAG: hypothetical protein DCC67_01750 [Planctomycetota bacterium]